LVFAMTGGAYAAKRYLITSTKQISPSVLKQLQGKAGAKTLFPQTDYCAARPPALLLFLASMAAAVLVAVGLSVAFPLSAQADATLAPSPVAGPPGLPDGRVYEGVSPANKYGNAAAPPIEDNPPAVFAEPAGDGVGYYVNGAAIGQTESGIQGFTVAKHVGYGWQNFGAQPRSLGEQALLTNAPEELGVSADLTRVYFSDQALYPPGAPRKAGLLYEIPTGSLTWLDPPPAYSPPESPESEFELDEEQHIAGYSSDMSAFYFATPSGFYEWREGALSVAGVLPDGSVDPKAEAAGFVTEEGVAKVPVDGNDLRNQVSEDGSRAFFVSAQGGTGAPELYVRERGAEGAESTALVSRDTLLPPVEGLPAAAPAGVVDVSYPEESKRGEALSDGEEERNRGYVYALPDGSRAFFQSTDALTSAARQAEEHGLPASDAKEYMFDTETGALTYLPGVADAPLVETFGSPFEVSAILVSSQDGSRFIFSSPSGLSLWSDEGGEGGTVTPIEPYGVGGEARATPDGSVFVFESAAPIPGFNNGGSHLTELGAGPFRNQEIYRYDVSQGSLSCVSCPPAGVVPSGNAYFSHLAASSSAGFPANFMRGAGISQDGSRVFFDTPDPLVPQDTNTAPARMVESGVEEFGRDVYEWENGALYLLSGGTSPSNSYLGDNSADGNDVFFSTAQGLAAGDTDEGYDVYDARVPRPGDRAPTVAAPCAGDVCQGPPSVPVLLGAPASATFSGLGNTTSEPATTPASKPKVKAKATKCKKGFVKKKTKCIKAKTKKAKKYSNSRRGN
jgi:hypothetical protein